jgi:hypothetical protein
MFDGQTDRQTSRARTTSGKGSSGQNLVECGRLDGEHAGLIVSIFFCCQLFCTINGEGFSCVIFQSFESF